MTAVTETQHAKITRAVRVEFDPDNNPTFEVDGKTYRLTLAVLNFEWVREAWQNPWQIVAVRSQMLKSGEWGTPRTVNVYQPRSLITELSNEYRPTARVEIKEIK